MPTVVDEKWAVNGQQQVVTAADIEEASLPKDKVATEEKM